MQIVLITNDDPCQTQQETGETITGARYRTQLMHLSRVLKEKRPQFEQKLD